MSTWTVRRGGVIVHDDDDAHGELVLRMLRIDAPLWRRTLETYAGLLPAAPVATAERLAALARAYALCSPHNAPLPVPPVPETCPICDATTVTAVVARNPGPLVFGRCGTCGHGSLMPVSMSMSVSGDRAAVATPYAEDAYYVRQSDTGVGYDGYERERTYRERKGKELLDRALALWERPGGAKARGARPRALLEVGSGFGFTRAAAAQHGIATAGVDVNPDAARAAERLYGQATFTGTLDAALRNAGSGIQAGAFDFVLYQFVLEHVADPIDELRTAASALADGGLLVLLVPSMEATEATVFGASYRSFRADHLHLFSRDSIGRALRRAGLAPLLVESGCNVHLLRGFLTAGELGSIYAAGAGPDLFVAATRAP